MRFDEIRHLSPNGDHAAVDRIYNRMVQVMDGAARVRAADPDAT
jgi:hypothetical protein